MRSVAHASNVDSASVAPDEYLIDQFLKSETRILDGTHSSRATRTRVIDDVQDATSPPLRNRYPVKTETAI